MPAQKPQAYRLGRRRENTAAHAGTQHGYQWRLSPIRRQEKAASITLLRTPRIQRHYQAMRADHFTNPANETNQHPFTHRN
jgi:hypothetical protein